MSQIKKANKSCNKLQYLILIYTESVSKYCESTASGDKHIEENLFINLFILFIYFTVDHIDSYRLYTISNSENQTVVIAHS